MRFLIEIKYFHPELKIGLENIKVAWLLTDIKDCNDNLVHKIRLKKSDIYAVKLHKAYSIKAPKGKGYRYMNIINRFQCRL